MHTDLQDVSHKQQHTRQFSPIACLEVKIDRVDMTHFLSIVAKNIMSDPTQRMD